MIDRALYRRALAVADQPVDRKNFINVVLRTFIAYQAQLRLAEMGGMFPDWEYVPRRRPPTDVPANWE